MDDSFQLQTAAHVRGMSQQPLRSHYCSPQKLILMFLVLIERKPLDISRTCLELKTDIKLTLYVGNETTGDCSVA